MNKIYTSCIGILITLLLVGCGQSSGSTSGFVDGVSYSAFWKGQPRSTDTLSLLVISDFSNDKSPAKGQGLFGSGWKPILSGYHDRDGEVVTFAMVERNRLLILDKYIELPSPPIVYVFRDKNGLLDVHPLSQDSEKAVTVLEEIHNE